MRVLRRFLVAASVMSLGVAAMPAPQAQAAVVVSVAIAPPAIPVYSQPVIPGPGYVWVPGYWAYGPDGYYWVPGTWVLPPAVGLLWTPGYWDWGGSAYVWHAGYWGPTVGFYGGINYGFGYFGVGYVGGYWSHDHFYYNSAYSNLGGVHVTNVYNRTVANVNSTASYHGGNGGTTARPSQQELAASHERHVGATSAQTMHVRAAAADPALRASVNQGRPAVAATATPGRITGSQTHGPVHPSQGTAMPRTTSPATPTAHPKPQRSGATPRTGTAPAPQSRATPSTHPTSHRTGVTPRTGTAPTPQSRATPSTHPTSQRSSVTPHAGTAPTPQSRATPPAHPTSRTAASRVPQGQMRAPAHPPTNANAPKGHPAPAAANPRAGEPHGAGTPPQQQQR